MLLNKEISYYTIFNFNSYLHDYPNLAEGVIDCLNNVGEIHDATILEDNNVEIWVNHPEYGMLAFYLFDYDQGVCTIGGA
jgi:hypothetical protein